MEWQRPVGGTSSGWLENRRSSQCSMCWFHEVVSRAGCTGLSLMQQEEKIAIIVQPALCSFVQYILGTDEDSVPSNTADISDLLLGCKTFCRYLRWLDSNKLSADPLERASPNFRG